MKNNVIILFVTLIISISSVAGQTATINGSTQISTGKGFYTFAYSSEKVVKDAPYSAEATTESVRVLGDGNKITRQTKTLLYRDGEGRTRWEEISKSTNAAETITIFDPVVGYKYYLNPTAKTARRIAAPAQKKETTMFYSAATPTPGSLFNFTASTVNGTLTAIDAAELSGFLKKSEDLRPRNIEGVAATGKSSTTTILAGTIGNERDIVSTAEVWYSKELQTTILNKRTDPQNGNYLYQLTNIKRSEPDKSLFTIPADYKIVDAPAGAATVFNFPKTH